MIKTIAYLEPPSWFNAHQDHLWHNLGKSDYFMQSFLYCAKIKKFKVKHTKKILYIRSNSTYYRYKKEADEYRKRYFSPQE